MRQVLKLTLWLVPASIATAGGSVSVFVGPPGGVGSVRVFDETAATPPYDPPQLQAIRLLPIELSGRTELEEFLPERARLHAGAPEATHLRLPAGGGSLYRYARTGSGGGSLQGLMVIGPTGAATSVLEMAEPAPGVEPFVSTVAVAPQGDALLVATSVLAGGDLLEIDLHTGAVTDRSAGLPPLFLSGSGLALQDTWGIAAEVDALLRFDRASPGDAAPVPFAQQPAPTWFSQEVVVSRSGAFAATIAGDDAATAFAYVFAPSGPAERASDTPMALSGAGFLPHAAGGPWLAVSDDGAHCAWRAVSMQGYGNELFLATVPASPATPPLHVTQDSLFEPFLDEIGQFIFTTLARFLFAAGDPDYGGSGGMTNVDQFQVALPLTAGVPPIQNLSGTSGQDVPPFLVYPTIHPLRTAFVPGVEGSLVLDGVGADLLSVEVDETGADDTFSDVASMDLMELVGGALVVALQSSDDPHEDGLWLLPDPLDDDTAQMVLALPAPNRVLRGVASPDGSTVGFVTTDGSSEFVWRLDVASGQVELLTPRPLVFGSTLGFAPNGALTLSVGPPGTPRS